MVSDEVPAAQLLWLEEQCVPRRLYSRPGRGPGQQHSALAPTSCLQRAPGSTVPPLHTVPCPPQSLAGVCCWGWWGRRGVSLPERLGFYNRRHQTHPSPRPHLDPQRPLHLPHGRVAGQAKTDEPGSGPGSCWVTLSKSLHVSEPQTTGRINTCPPNLQKASGLHSPHTNEGQSKEVSRSCLAGILLLVVLGCEGQTGTADFRSCHLEPGISAGHLCSWRARSPASFVQGLNSATPALSSLASHHLAAEDRGWG